MTSFRSQAVPGPAPARDPEPVRAGPIPRCPGTAPEPAPGELLPPGRPRGLWAHRLLVQALVRRELTARWGRGGRALLHCLASPAALVALHALLGLGILRLPWGASGGGSGSAPLVSLALGVLVYSTFAEVALTSPGLMSRSPGLVKRVAFPLETLVAARVLAVWAGALPAAVVLVLAALSAGASAASLAWGPLVLAPAALATGAIAYLGAALGPFWRDAARVMALAVHALHLLSPVVYPLAALPPPWRPLALLNPLAVSIEGARTTLLAGTSPDPGPLLASLAGTALALAGGRWLFLRVEKGFADVV